MDRSGTTDARRSRTMREGRTWGTGSPPIRSLGVPLTTPAQFVRRVLAYVHSRSYNGRRRPLLRKEMDNGLVAEEHDGSVRDHAQQVRAQAAVEGAGAFLPGDPHHRLPDARVLARAVRASRLPKPCADDLARAFSVRAGRRARSCRERARVCERPGGRSEG